MTVPLTEEWLTEQLRLCEAATKGPWFASPGSGPGYGHLRIKAANQQKSWVQHEADCRFVVAACEGYLLTLKELQSLYASFALYSKVTQDARKLYLEEHPKFTTEFGDLAEPDTGKVLAWLVEGIRQRPWAECPQCSEMYLESDLTDIGICQDCAAFEEASDDSTP